MENRAEYLRRIGLAKMPAATEDGLRELHAAQAFAIPFENPSVLPFDIELDPEKLVRLSAILEPPK